MRKSRFNRIIDIIEMSRERTDLLVTRVRGLEVRVVRLEEQLRKSGK